ncbi:DNA translocase FtsK [Sphingobacterium bambusae]|uniref:DNA translocase FtsK n=1 Tax=Sphingobacterium bambusae TaxID=662858 RepID=A0ABW6BJD5_9SPHI|nr:DNA translocase FtsK [Sphingobacterium bambusae]WPL49368.1 DNA translocase FtsK [Sphingobacterium bambusae]
MKESDHCTPVENDKVNVPNNVDQALNLSTYHYPSLDLLPEDWRKLILNAKELSNSFVLPLLLDAEGTPVLQDMYRYPNVLIAGTIASGKTQFIYNQILLWLYFYHPAEIKLVICRSKPVDYNSLLSLEKHYLAKLSNQDYPISEGPQVTSTIAAMVLECDSRLELFRKAGVRTISDYNERFVSRHLSVNEGHRFLPNIVVLLDDLQTFLDDNEVEKTLVDLLQRNFYTGIYVIAATSQIMSRSITPQIRANFSLRIGMKLMSQNESQRILDRVGAEKLRLLGELLYESSGRLIKARQPVIDYASITKVTDFIGRQRGYPSAMMLPSSIAAIDQNDDFSLEDQDYLFVDAARLVVMHQQGSTSLIQRKLKLGYNRAGRLMDAMEAAGIVGPFEGSKARDVLYATEDELEEYLSSLSGGKQFRPLAKADIDVRNQHPIDTKVEIFEQDKFPKSLFPDKQITNKKKNRNSVKWVLLLVVGFILYYLLK